MAAWSDIFFSRRRRTTVVPTQLKNENITEKNCVMSLQDELRSEKEKSARMEEQLSKYTRRRESYDDDYKGAKLYVWYPVRLICATILTKHVLSMAFQLVQDRKRKRRLGAE
jgi:hypothetical protein